MKQQKDETVKKTTIGGQALIEGIMMRGPRRTVIVVRKSNGELVEKVDEIGTGAHGKAGKLPLLRGVLAYWDALKYGVSALNYSAEFIEDEEGAEPGRFERWLTEKLGSDKLNKLLFGFALLLGIAIPIGLFILLPTLIAGLISVSEINLVRNLTEGVLRMLIFLGFIILTSRQKDVKRTYMYHGAEHKTIYCYEKGLPLTVENVRQQSRFHPRCGTSFLFVVMLISILFFSLFTWSTPWMRMLIRLAMLPVVVGISYEANRYAGRHDNWVTRLLRAPGMFLQRFTTNEPDDSMIEVGIAALNGVIPENDQEDRW